MLVLAPASSINTSRPLSHWPWTDFHHSRRSLTSSRSCSLARSVFFIGQLHPPQNVVDGWQGAGQLQSLPHLGQRDIRLILNQPAQLASVRRGEKRLAPRVPMTRGNIPGFFALGQELFYHTEGDTIAVGDLLAGKFAFPATGQNPLPQVQGKSLSHGTAVYHKSIIKATVLFKMI
jgi:hypothetical protein